MCKIEKYSSICFVTNVVRLILNIVSTNLEHGNEHKQMDTDAFDLKNKMSGVVFLCFNIFFILSSSHCLLFVFP